MGNIFNTRSEFDKREEQERIEAMNVAYGNAPLAKDTQGSAPVSGPAMIDTATLTNQTTSDNKCPSCGASLSGTKGETIQCPYCGTTYTF